jgi:isopentenyl diphosphate isomerase/L-lactate dehydrogenase-like FMN-dependent dehydrogenase
MTPKWRAGRPGRLFSVAHAKAIAKKRVPKVVYDFLEGGTEDELTVANNRQAFADLTFRPRVGVAFEERRQETTVLGSRLAMPVALAPAGFLRFACRDAEILAAQAAGDFGTAIGVSTMASSAIEDVAAATPGPVWFQVYFAGGRQGAEVGIERAKRAGCTALLVTLDSAAVWSRDAIHINGGLPNRISMGYALRHAPELLSRPGWCLDFLKDGLALPQPNIRLSEGGPSLDMSDARASFTKAPPTWEDLKWIRDRFAGKVVAKGVITGEDARRALDFGADGVVVSNHGGYMLDGAPGTLRALPEVVAAVGDKVDVLLDGGVRRGTDVIKALALGAKCVLVGRAYVWALAAAGGLGVSDMLLNLREGVDRTLALVGCPSIADLDPSYLNIPNDWATGKHNL